jgi:hypothetical protein
MRDVGFTFLSLTNVAIFTGVQTLWVQQLTLVLSD